MLTFRSLHLNERREFCGRLREEPRTQKKSAFCRHRRVFPVSETGLGERGRSSSQVPIPGPILSSAGPPRQERALGKRSPAPPPPGPEPARAPGRARPDRRFLPFHRESLMTSVLRRPPPLPPNASDVRTPALPGREIHFWAGE